MDTSQNFDYSSAIIGPQFCSPNPELTVTRIFLRRLKFTDSSGDVVFRTMNLAVINFRKRARLVDASKNPIVSFKKKLFSRKAEWSVYGGESFEAKDLILAVEKTKMFQFKIKLNVFLANNTAKEVCDFRIEGNYFGRSCKIFKGDSDQVVAQMKKEEKLANKIFKRSSYVVSIDPNTDLAFVAVLFAIRHEFYMARKKNLLTLGIGAIVDAILIALH